jgi:hypothetical protein
MVCKNECQSYNLQKENNYAFASQIKFIDSQRTI